MKCPNCKDEMIQQQATTEDLHIEQIYCPKCEKAILTDKEVCNNE